MDSDYRGELIVCIRNFSTETHVFEAGDKIAQLILERIVLPQPIKVDTLDNTQRGEGGFGSTGK